MSGGPALVALSDLHLRHAANRAALRTIAPRPGSWIVLAGDVGERLGELDEALAVLGDRFERVLWVPGNHELWTDADGLGGVRKYEALVDLCRRRGALTPEDPYAVWTGPGGPVVVALLFLLYDYSFAPAGMGPEDAVRWARDGGVLALDELRLAPGPYPDRAAWCHARVAEAERRLVQEDGGLPRVLVNHWPLRRDLVRIPRVPRYLPWCGTAATEDWHRRFRARVVVSGHLHVRATDWRDGVRFEEVSMGYPRQWGGKGSADGLLRAILPGPDVPSVAEPDPVWHAPPRPPPSVRPAEAVGARA